MLVLELKNANYFLRKNVSGEHVKINIIFVTQVHKWYEPNFKYMSIFNATNQYTRIRFLYTLDIMKLSHQTLVKKNLEMYHEI